MRKPRFAPKPDTRFPHFQIYLQYTYTKGRLLRYYTGVTVPKEFWDKEKERAKPDRKFPDYAEINAQLNRIETEAAQIALRSQYNKSNLTNEVFKNELDTFLGKKVEVEKSLTFLNYFSKVIEERRANPNYAPSSIKVYVSIH